jgi:hypothetical protein
MSIKDTIRQIEILGAAEQQEVADFVDSLSKRKSTERTKSTRVPKSFSEGSYFGIWRDRPEMEDSTQWVRRIRKEHWGIE